MKSSIPDSESERRKRCYSPSPEEPEYATADGVAKPTQPLDIELSNVSWRVGIALLLGLAMGGVVIPLFVMVFSVGAAVVIGGGALVTILAICAAPFLLFAGIASLRGRKAVRSHGGLIASRVLAKLGLIGLGACALDGAVLLYARLFWKSWHIEIRATPPIGPFLAAAVRFAKQAAKNAILEHSMTVRSADLEVALRERRNS